MRPLTLGLALVAACRGGDSAPDAAADVRSDPRDGAPDAAVDLRSDFPDARDTGTAETDDPAPGPIRYASPAGSPTGDGLTPATAWDLPTALGKPLPAGTALYLGGGVYRGRFAVAFDGVTVRSAPGAWAVVDGYWQSTLAAALAAATPGEGSFCRFANGHAFPTPSTIAIERDDELDREQVRLTARKDDGYDCLRGMNRGGNPRPPAAHPVGAVVYTAGNTFEVGGRDNTFRDFEVRDANPRRVFTTSLDPSNQRGGEAFFVAGSGNTFVNLVIHDNQDGFYFAETAAGTRAAGNLLFNNGHVDPRRGNGHGFYIANGDPTRPTIIENNISFGNYATGMKAYGVNAAVRGVRFLRNISFENGSPASFEGNPAGLPRGHRQYNLEVGSENMATDAIEFRGNLTWAPLDAIGQNAILGAGGGTGDVTVTFVDNYVVGGGTTLATKIWMDQTVTGNTLVTKTDFAADLGTQAYAVLLGGTGGRATWNDNRYFDVSRKTGAFAPSFGIAGVGNKTFPEWQAATGFDAASSYTATLPTENAAFVIPSADEAGRAHAAVYRWSASSTVRVPLSGLGFGEGDRVLIKNAQTYRADPTAPDTLADVVADLRFSAGIPHADVDMAKVASLGVTKPIGHDPPSAVPTAPAFAAFVIVRGP